MFNLLLRGKIQKKINTMREGKKIKEKKKHVYNIKYVFRMLNR